jgi:hypothetical protein
MVRHADAVAWHLGEPYGSVLTISAIVIEVSLMTSIIPHGENNPTLACDAMFTPPDDCAERHGWGRRCLWAPCYWEQE